MLRKVLFALPVLAIVGFVLAQDVTLDPGTWFTSVDSILIAGSLISPWIVKILTALGKDWFGTDGTSTVWLSFAVSLAIAGVGGYMALGFLAGSSGLSGALQAVVMVAVAFLGSNGWAKHDRQVATAALKRMKG